MEQRTNAQNRSLHLYCKELADELNGAGIPMKAFIENIEVDHTMQSVKSLWHAIAKAKYGKSSTTELTKREINEVYEEINRHISQWGLHMAWPSNEPPLLEEI